MFRKLRQLARDVAVLKPLVGWRQLGQLAKEDLGLEIGRDDSFFQKDALVLAPHADDEVFGCGFAIARHRHSGSSVTVLVLHDGSYGNAAGTRDPSLVPVRRDESRAALDLLGGGNL